MERARLLEGVAAGGAALSVPLAIAGAALGSTGLGTAALGVLALAVLAGKPLDTYGELLTPAREGERQRQVRTWTVLKVAGIVIHLLVVLAGITLLLAALLRAGLVGFETQAVDRAAVASVVRAFVAAMVSGMALVHHLSLVVPLERDGSPLRDTTAYAALGAAVLFGVATQVVAQAPLALGPITVSPVDAPYLQLAAAGFTGIALVAVRSPPTLGLLLVDEAAYYRGHTSLSRKRSVAAPAALAVSLLVAVLFGGVVLVVGLGDLLGLASRNAAVGGTLALLSLGILGAGAAALFLWRAGRDVPVYQPSPDRRRQIELAIVYGSVLLGLVPAGLAVALRMGRPVLGLDTNLWIELSALAVLVWTGPTGLWFHRKNKRVRALEAHFPDFLRDIAASRQAGLTLEKSIRIAGRSDYGALDPEVAKMADQLAWNVNFQDALRRFADRVGTSLVQRAVLLVDEADRAGGDVTGILMAAARDAREVKSLERNRRTSMGLYTMVIYVAFLVFLGVTAAMFATFVPQIVQAASDIGGSGAGLTGITFGQRSVGEFRAFYFVMAMVQAGGSGMVAGLVESGNATDGLKHVFVMTLLTLLAFTFIG